MQCEDEGRSANGGGSAELTATDSSSTQQCSGKIYLKYILEVKKQNKYIIYLFLYKNKIIYLNIFFKYI